MAFDNSLYEYDVGYYEYTKNIWLPGKAPPGSTFGRVSRKAVEALCVELRDSDVLLGTYPKTGRYSYEGGSPDLGFFHLEKHHENEKIFGPHCRDPLILLKLYKRPEIKPVCDSNMFQQPSIEIHWYYFRTCL